MADHSFAEAQTWDELVQAHEKWVVEYNYQHHWAHRKRTDHRYSPAAVLGWVRGQEDYEGQLDYIFNALRFNRKLNRLGYIRFRHWQLYGEYGLARQSAAVWLYKTTLTVQFEQQPLSEYATEFGPQSQQLYNVKFVRDYQTSYRSPQLDLWPQGEVEWHRVLKRQGYAPRRLHIAAATQFALPW